MVAPLTKEPECRHEIEAIRRETRRLGLVELGGAADPGPAALVVKRSDDAAHDPERGRLADDRVEVEARVQGAGHHCDLEALRDRLPHDELADVERTAR